MHHVKANFQSDAGTIRRESFDGREHVVVPVVMICDGVMNDALVTHEEFGRYVDAWNGRPVPVGHPQENGEYISANRPDIIERSIGTTFNARVDGDKLKADLWICADKATALGYGELLASLESGGVVEVSTGYFSDDEPAPGNFNGAPYSVIHRNIRPDHLALLPDEQGACSVADGCGTRVNSKRGGIMSTLNEAMATIAHALGLKSNCACEDQMPDILEQAQEAFKANAIDAKQLAAIQKMNPADREVMGAFIAALNMAGDPGEAEAMAEDEQSVMPDETSPVANAGKALTEAGVNRLIANGVETGIRRRDVTAKLTANSANELTAEDMAGMSVDALERLEKTIRPVDYSGAGGFAAHSDVVDDNVVPLGTGGGVVSRLNKKEG